jgi:hypothetical protein
MTASFCHRFAGILASEHVTQFVDFSGGGTRLEFAASCLLLAFFR